MKETKIEKLILDLSNRWECTPQEAVDRLNSMNESEINKLINSMTKKFQWGGLVKPPIQPRFVAPAHLDPSIQQPAPSMPSSKLLTAMMRKERRNEAQKLMEQASDLRSKQYTDFLKQQEINKSTHSNQNTNRIMKNGGFIDCLRNGGSVEKCKCGCGKIAKAAKGTNEDGLTVQTPKNEKDLKWEGIKSSFGYGKAAKYITKDGKWQKTEYDYPEATIFGNGNDFTLWVKRDPQTGVVGTAPSDSLVSTKVLPFIKLPIRMSGDAPAIRSTVKQEKGGELKKYNNPLPKKSKFKK